MGLKNARPTFQHLMNGVDWLHELVYIDDIYIFSTTFEQHFALLRDVLTKLRAAHLRLNWNPANANCFNRVWYIWDMKCRQMGYKCTTRPHQIVATCKTPQNMSEVRCFLEGFLGLASCYRKFCQNFATVLSYCNGWLNQRLNFNGVMNIMQHTCTISCVSN